MTRGMFQLPSISEIFWIKDTIKWKFLDHFLKQIVYALKNADLVSNVLSCYYIPYHQDTKNSF